MTRRSQKEGVVRSGAKMRRRGLRGWFRNYLARHLQVLFYALGQLSLKPFSTLMTAAVIGIALAMPTGLHVLLKNVQQVLGGWDGAAQLSLFLHQDVRENDVLELADELRARPGIASVEYVSSEQAMLEFQRHSGFGEALKALEDNPLPPVLVVYPTLEQQGPGLLQQLREELAGEKSVEIAQLDMQWVKRLYALMDIGKRGVWVLAAMFALGVLLVVGNTIRLGIQNRRDEIVIIKLIGGTNAFIRRPFLYTGFWYGLLGGIIAFALIEVALWMLSVPVNNLATLYSSDFRLASIDLLSATVLLSGSILLGWLGSWLAVGRHLRAIEPT